MRGFSALAFFGAVLVCAAAPPSGKAPVRPRADARQFKPRFAVLPVKNATQLSRAALQQQSAAAATIPLWDYSVFSPLDAQTYTGTMVGRSPFYHGHRATSVTTYLVPVVLTFADTQTVFDPTVTDSCLGDSVVNVTVNSPMFQNVSYTMNGANVGSTQYVDAFQRANFWNKVAGTPYHTLLGGKVLPAVNVTVPVAYGSTNVESSTGCAYGTMDINWWDNYLQSTIMPQLAAQGVGPTVFPIFLFNAVFEYDSDPSQCCILGYHSGYTTNNILQTYSISSWDTSGHFGGDISITSHELAEWMDDPDGSNATPAWGHVGQVSGCQGNLEVGDPLTNTNYGSVTLHGYTYSLQELAFFSWFFRQSPSVGAGGLDSNGGSFSSGQPVVCQ